jgi:hypothetical protein
MRRKLAALAAVGIMVLTPGSAATSSAAMSDRQARAPLDVHLHEISVSFGTLVQEYIEIANRGFVAVDIGNSVVLVSVGPRIFQLARIPVGTFLEPRQVFLLAKVGSVLLADLFYDSPWDLPNRHLGVALVGPDGDIEDSMATMGSIGPVVEPSSFLRGRPAPEPKRGLCLNRVKFTDDNSQDWVNKVCTPGSY